MRPIINGGQWCNRKCSITISNWLHLWNNVEKSHRGFIYCIKLFIKLLWCVSLLHNFSSFFLHEHTCGSGELGVMTASLSGPDLDMPSPATSQRPPTVSCFHHCHRVYMCASARVCVWVRECAHPAAEQDPIWFAPLACEARLWGSTSLYSPNGFPSPLLLTLPQTPVMCTLVNIHIRHGGRKRGSHRDARTRKDSQGRGREIGWKSAERESATKGTEEELGSHPLGGWPWGGGLFNLGILRALNGPGRCWSGETCPSK